MKQAFFILIFCSLLFAQQSRFVGYIEDAIIVETKESTIVVKIVSKDRLFYIETEKEFSVTEKDSIYEYLIDYSKPYLKFQNNIKLYKILSRYLEYKR